MWHDAEPLYGTLCLYHREKREKLSEDFHFRCLPSEFQDVLLHITLIFYVLFILSLFLLKLKFVYLLCSCSSKFSFMLDILYMFY